MPEDSCNIGLHFKCSKKECLCPCHTKTNRFYNFKKDQLREIEDKINLIEKQRKKLNDIRLDLEFQKRKIELYETK